MTDEERKKRIHDITYSTDDREELAERIVALEELCADMNTCISHGAGWSCDDCPLHDTEKCDFDKRMDELGVPH